MGLKVGCLAGFFHHHVTTMSVHTHAYCYLLYESGTKQVSERLLYAEKI